MKKLLMVLTLLPLMALANVWTDPSTGIAWNYQVGDDGGASLGNGGLAVQGDCCGALIIPSQMEGYVVTRIESTAFNSCRLLTSVKVPSCVQWIGEGAFHGCAGLTEMELPFVGCGDAVHKYDRALFGEIFGSAFYDGGVEIDQHYIVSSYITYNHGVFCLPASLNKIVINSSRWIVSGAFVGCTPLRQVVISLAGGGVGDNAFQGCSGLASVEIGGGVTEIGDYAFSGCTSLTSVRIAKGVSNIGNYAFENCRSLKSVTIPSSVMEIGWYAFSFCSGLEDLKLSSGIINIWSHAFEGCSSLTSVVIPSTVGLLGTAAFASCENLKTMTMPGSWDLSFAFDGEYLNFGSGMFWGSPVKTFHVTNGTISNLKKALEDGGMDLSGVSFDMVKEPSCVYYGIMFDVQGGEPNPSSRTVGKGEKYGELPEVSRAGYFFDGWFTAATGGSRVTASTTVSGDITLYAHWTKKAICTINLDAQGGDVEWVPKTVEEGDAVGELPVAEQENREFLGWYTAAIGGIRVNAKTVVTKDVTFYAHWRRTDSSADYDLIVGDKVELDAGLVGYSTKMLPKGLSLNAKTGKITGAAKEITASDGSAVTFTKKGEEDVSLIFVVRAEEMSVGCEGLSVGTLPAGVQGSATGEIELRIDSETGTKSVSVSKLPTGMKYDTKKGVITGAPTKTGSYEVSVTVTTKAGNKKTEKILISVAAMPMMAVGKFDGFVSVGEDNLGTFTLTTTDAGKLTAKVITAAGTVSFSGTCWDSVEDGVYRATLTTKKGEKLTLTLDSTAAWDANQLSGEFTTVAVPSRTYSVSAQRNAFGKTWYFAATGDETMGWKLAYTEDTKGAALTVTLKADGSTSIAGKLPNGTDTKGKAVTVKVSASGYANVGGLKEGAILADFAPVLTVNKVKTVLAITTNLWFDRKNEVGRSVGAARFVK